MGTDIHGVFQRRDKLDGKWYDVPSYYENDRHYQLFAVLAGVRNGLGFAGIKTGDTITPIAEPRGLPDDFLMDGGSHPLESLEIIRPEWRKYYEDDRALWMGDHSHSWLTGDEILAWAENAPTVTKFGILDRSEYEIWDGINEPSSFCGDVWGKDLKVINNEEDEKAQSPNWTYIRCTWQSNLQDELSYFIDEVARLVTEYGEIRFVFGFDS